MKEKRGARKPQVNLVDALVEAADEIQGRARRRGPKKPSARGTRITLPRKPKVLSTGEYLIAVADSSSVTVSKVRARSLPEDQQYSATTWAGPRTNLTEIVLAVAELAAAGLIPKRGQLASIPEGEEHVLSSGGFDLAEPNLEVTDPVSRAAAEFATLVSDSYTTEEAADILDVNTSRIRQRVAGIPRTLFGIKVGNEWRIPQFQFTGKSLIPDLEKVIAELSVDLHPVAVYRWFTTPNPDLSQDDEDESLLSPLDWLKTGGSSTVVAELASHL